MELEWYEKNLIVALRVLLPFFRKYKYHLSGLELNSRDGEYLIFRNVSENVEVNIILNPGFDILIEKKVGILKLNKETTSLIYEKKASVLFASLPDNYSSEEELEQLLTGYILFMEHGFKEHLI